MTTTLAHIKEFLLSHPSEVVLLSVRRDAGSTKKGCEVSILESDFWVCKELRSFLGPALKADTTIGELVDRKQNVIYFYEEQERCIGETFKLVLEPTSTTKFRSVEPYDEALKVLLAEKGLDVHSSTGRKIPWSTSLEEFIQEAAEGSDDTLKIQLSLESESVVDEEASEDNGEVLNHKQSDDPGLLEFSEMLNRADHALDNLMGGKEETTIRANRVPTLVAQGSCVNFDQKQGILGNLFFASPLRTAESRIVKSWGKTSDPDPQILIKKLKIWSATHGKAVPRPPFVFKVLAGEVTAPNFNVDFTQGEVVRWWLGAAGAALTFQAVGNEAEAHQTNE